MQKHLVICPEVAVEILARALQAHVGRDRMPYERLGLLAAMNPRYIRRLANGEAPEPRFSIVLRLVEHLPGTFANMLTESVGLSGAIKIPAARTTSVSAGLAAAEHAALHMRHRLDGIIEPHEKLKEAASARGAGLELLTLSRIYSPITGGHLGVERVGLV
jgi:hypothetical protein